MSRTFKDKKLEYKYPEWRYDFDYVVYSEYEVDYPTVADSEQQYKKPRVKTRITYIQGPTRKLKKKRHVKTEFYHMYGTSAPSWWVRITMNRPKRRACRLWERKVLFQDIELADCPDFKNKPFKYYY